MLNVIYLDDDIIVCVKPAGISSEDGMTGLIGEYLGGGVNIRTVHRLDKAVSGLTVYALSGKAAAGLSDQIARKVFEKTYLATVHGVPSPERGRYDDLLFHDSGKNRTYVVNRMRKGVRDAALEYEVIGIKDALSLVRIKLLTGRTHQIRAQFSSRKMPLAGDRKYGARDKCGIALWPYSLEFIHPSTGDKVSFRLAPPEIYPWDLFDEQTDGMLRQDLEPENCS